MLTMQEVEHLIISSDAKELLDPIALNMSPKTLIALIVLLIIK